MFSIPALKTHEKLTDELLEVTLLVGHGSMHVDQKREANKVQKYAHCEVVPLCERLMGWNVVVR